MENTTIPDSTYYVSDGTGGVVSTHGPVQTPADHVLIRTEYAGVNRGDVLELLGAYGESPARGTRVGQDIVGIVEAAPDSGSAHWVGQRVFGQISGAWGEYATASAKSLALAGDLAPEVAVALPLAGFTALRLARQASAELGNLHGRDVLITGGTGAVGTLLTQLLVRQGATVWLLSRRPDYQARAGVNVVRALSEVPEVAIVFESIGGPLLAESLSHLMMHGHLWWFGEASREPGTLDFFGYLNRSPLHIHHFAHWIHDGSDSEDLAELRDLVASGDVEVPLTQQITMPELPGVLADIAAGRLHEKAIIRF